MNIIIIRGGGDLGTGVAYRLFKAGYKVLVLDIEEPLSIRRNVSFSEAIYSGEIIIEDVHAVLAKDMDQIQEAIDYDFIPVYIDPKGTIINKIKPFAVVDCIIAKKNLGTNKRLAPITIAVGPGFEAGVDVDLVIESKRGHNLGKVIHKGMAAANTGIPGNTMGFKEERIIRAEASGIIRSFYKIGDMVEKGEVICEVDGVKTLAQIPGVLRGMIKDGIYVKKGLKIGDIDPRGIREYAFTISDKALSIGGGVLEAIMYLSKKM